MSAPRDIPDIALLYEEDAHNEPVTTTAGPEGPKVNGLFGRHVANSEFLEAWLRHGTWQRLVSVVANQVSANGVTNRFARYAGVTGPRRQLNVVGLPEFQARFFPHAPAQVLHLPQPIEPQFGWVRHHKGRHAFALSGVTHTISLPPIMDRLRDLVTGPFEPYDTLFCISKATVSAVRAVADNYAAFLRERQGGDPKVRVRLEHIPFGIDTEKFRPATPNERATARQQFGIAPDEVCLLFVGRLSYFSKAHPFPMYRAAAEAARRTGRKVHLVLAGWAETQQMLQRFQQGAEAFAPGVKTSIFNAMDNQTHQRVWHAADVFTSMSDNIQESLGLTILEAQACGLPVVTTDWDGCRDTVAPGETGYLVSTRMVAGATADGSSRHLMGETGNDRFLGETNQAVAVDSVEAGNAFARLFADAGLRSRMGAAGRDRILRQYTWPSIIAQYEAVWREQEALRRQYAARSEVSTVRGPVPFPDVEYSFGSYPTAILGSDALLVTAVDATSRVELLLRMPLSNYLPKTRIVDQELLVRVLESAAEPCTVAALASMLGTEVDTAERRLATLAWMLKYDLLRAAIPRESA